MENPVSGPWQFDSADQEVRASYAGVERYLKRLGHLVPLHRGHQGHLPQAPLVGASNDAGAPPLRRMLNPVHWASMEAFDPEPFQSSHVRSPVCHSS